METLRHRTEPPPAAERRSDTAVTPAPAVDRRGQLERPPSSVNQQVRAVDRVVPVDPLVPRQQAHECSEIGTQSATSRPSGSQSASPHPVRGQAGAPTKLSGRGATDSTPVPPPKTEPRPNDQHRPQFSPATGWSGSDEPRAYCPDLVNRNTISTAPNSRSSAAPTTTYTGQAARRSAAYIKPGSELSTRQFQFQPELPQRWIGRQRQPSQHGRFIWRHGEQRLPRRRKLRRRWRFAHVVRRRWRRWR